LQLKGGAPACIAADIDCLRNAEMNRGEIEISICLNFDQGNIAQMNPGSARSIARLMKIY
jgi:hypothetical protein